MSYSNVVMVSGGYPEAYKKGKKITGLNNEYESTILHAGTKKQNNNIITNGGRVLSVISKGKDFTCGCSLSWLKTFINSGNWARTAWSSTAGSVIGEIDA